MTAPGEDSDLSGPVERALARLPVALADERARRSLQAVARALPSSLTTGPLGLEIRLAGATAVALFAAAIPGTPAFEALVRALAQPAAASTWAAPDRARDLAAVLDRWPRKEGAIHRVARYLLVEADAPEDPDDAVAVPSIFLAPRAHRDYPRPGQPPNAFHRMVEATVTATAELSGAWPDPAAARALEAVVAAIPPEGDIFAVGAMVSRAAGSSIRVAVRRLGVDGIHAVLRAAGLPREADTLAECARAAPAAKQAVAFEVGPGAERRAGLELSPPHYWEQALLSGWPELLDHLVALGVADADRAAAVPGLVDPRGSPRWGLAHVKVSAVGSGLLPVSKLYVGLNFHPAEAT